MFACACVYACMCMHVCEYSEWFPNLVSKSVRTPTCKLIERQKTALNGLLYKFTIEKPLKTMKLTDKDFASGSMHRQMKTFVRGMLAYCTCSEIHSWQNHEQ